MPAIAATTSNAIGGSAAAGPVGDRSGRGEIEGPGVAEAAEPLVETKLVPPRLQERVVLRPRLLERLTRGTARPVTIVSGGAGAGKTVAVASWVKSGHPPGPVAWVSLDSFDNQPARFWSHVLAVLRSTGTVPEDNPLADLVPLQRPSEVFSTRLASGLAQLRQPVVLVLDDLHLVNDRSVLQQLATLLQHPSLMLRLVLLTRVDPLLPLLRLRLDARSGEIRGNDLAFTSEEAGLLFAKSGLAMTRTEIDRLVERTEGWAAGLRLAALSFERKAATASDPPEFSDLVDQFVAAEQTISDYLLEEVLSEMSDADRDFLLRTSVVDDVCDDLAQALTGRADGQRVLESLERSNAFVAVVGTGRVWFRYHQLFRETLRHELRLRAPGLVSVTHRAAAAWLSRHGEPIEALRHAIEGQDWAFIDRLAIRSLLPHILGPDRATLCALLGQLPEDQVQAHAGLSLALALRDFHVRDVQGMCGRAASAARLAARAEADTAPILVIVRLVEMAAARLRGDSEAVIAAATDAETVLADIPAGVVPAVAYQGLIFGNRGASLLWSGDLVGAERELTAGLQAALAARLDLSQMGALGHLALIAVGRGELRVAYERARVATDVAERRGWTAESLAATAYLALAMCHFEWGNPAEAKVHLDQATDAHRADRELPVAVALQVARARFHVAAGETAAAQAAITAARACYGGRPLPALLRRLVAVEEADLDLATGHPERVRDRFHGLDVGDIDMGSTDRERVRLARAELALDQPWDALAVVGPLLSEDPSNPGPAVEAWLVTALAADRLLADDRALDALSAALQLAASETRRRPFLTADPRLHELLARHAGLVGTQHDFVAEILLDVAQRQAPRMPPAPPTEPLTDRERAVLRYLPTLVSNAELAEHLHISVNTVKAHLKSLYRKLGVPSRRQAVQRARELGLL